MASRFATEKGVEVLLDALPEILRVFPQAVVQFVGAYKNVVGEEKYFHRLAPRIRQYEKSGNWCFLGFIPDEDMASFYANLDVLVLPSLNSTESFGIVQVEAMIEGVPVAASDLPGVRQPVAMHGMGKVFPPGDANALAECVLELLQNRSAYVRDPQPIQMQYLPESIAENYEREFVGIQREIGAAPITA
jgi:glycosyltransferase involved in cell wall biosynthesis